MFKANVYTSKYDFIVITVLALSIHTRADNNKNNTEHLEKKNELGEQSRWTNIGGKQSQWTSIGPIYITSLANNGK